MDQLDAYKDGGLYVTDVGGLITRNNYLVGIEEQISGIFIIAVTVH